MSHTPGPWRYEMIDSTAAIFKEERYLAGVSADFGVQTEPNARLIASAPALLEALEEAYNYIHFTWHQHSELEPGHASYTLHGKRLSFDADNIREAIRTARGE